MPAEMASTESTPVKMAFQSTNTIKDMPKERVNQSNFMESNTIHKRISTSLKTSYEKHTRPLMDAIDNIRSLGLDDNDLQLPKVAVIGDQSVGKTSCLEAMCGIQLPRGQGIVTRVPLELRLRMASDTNSWKCRIQYTPPNQQTVNADINSPAEVAQAVRDAQKAITGDDSSLADTLITMEVTSPDVPDLTLIDLPGIARFSEENPEIENQIKSMIKFFIKSEQTLICVVFPASTDIDTVGAFRLARDADPQSKRTMGVMTKMDLLGPGDEKLASDILTNKKLNLGLGVFGVRCRSQQDIESSIPLSEACKKEEDFFRFHQYFGGGSQKLFGIRNVSDKLARVLTSEIRGYLPKINEHVSARLQTLKKELDLMGKGPSSELSEKKRELLSILTVYTEVAMRVTRGEYKNDREEWKVFAKWRQETDRFAQQVKEITEKDVKDNLSNDGQILQNLRNQRGKKLPGFVDSFPICEQIITGLLINWAKPGDDYLNNVLSHVEKTLRELASETFERYPNLGRRVKEIVDEQLQIARQNIDQDIKKIFKQESFVWTQDTTYETQRTVILADPNRQKPEVKEDDPAGWVRFVQDVMDGVSSYMQVASRRVMDTIPQTVFYHTLRVLPDLLKEYVLSVACDDQGIVELFQEREDIANQRTDLTDLLNKWRQVEKQLAAL